VTGAWYSSSPRSPAAAELKPQPGLEGALKGRLLSAVTCRGRIEATPRQPGTPRRTGWLSAVTCRGRIEAGGRPTTPAGTGRSPRSPAAAELKRNHADAARAMGFTALRGH